MLGYGVLGLGDAAKRLFIPGLARSTEGRLVAVGSRDMEKARVWAAEHRCEATDYDGLLDREDVDVVWVGLPVSLHAEWAIRALEAGKHVYCEKPMAGSLADTLRVLQAARGARRRVMEGYMFRFHPLWAAAKNALEEIGPARSIVARFGFAIQPGNPRLIPELDMGAFNDAGGYTVSAVRGLFRQEAIEAAARFTYRDGVNYAASAWLRFRSGDAFIETGYDRAYRCEYEAWAARGRMRVERAFTTPADLAPTIEIVTPSSARVQTVEPENHFAHTIDAFARSIRQGGGEELFEQEAWRQAQTMDAVRRAASSGGWVPLDREEY